MILELQVAAEKLRQVLLAQVRARVFCLPDMFSLLGGTYVLDRIEFSDKSTIGRVNGSVNISVPGTPAPTITAITGRLVEYVQPLTIFAAELATLDANGQSPSTNSFQEDKLHFELTLQVKAGVPQLRFRLASVEPSVTAAIIQSKANIDITMDLDLSSVQGVLGGGPVAATNAGMTIDAAGARVVMRIELNGLTNSVAEWRAFFRSDPVDLLGTNDWSLLVDKDLIVPLALSRVSSAVAGAKDFALVSGPSGSWMSASPAVYVTLTGDALKACSCFGVDVNVRVLVAVSVEMSVPSGAPDVLRLRTSMGFVPDGAPIACCAVTGALFWHVLGAAMLAEGDIGWGEFLGGVALGPLGVYIAINVVGFNQKPAINPGAACTKISDTEFQCDQPLTVSAGLDFSLTLRSIAANPGGPLLEGTMRTAPPAAVPMLAVDRVEPFDWRLEGSCHSGFRAACHARIYLRGARTICKVEVRDDPQGCYFAAVERNPLDPAQAMPHITITPDVDKLVALMAPYPCRVLLWTDGGARLITIPPPKAITAQQSDTLDKAGQKARVRCLTDTSGFWQAGGRLSRKWLVDPPPDTYYEQVWQVLVTGLTVVEQVVAEDVAGDVVATALPSVGGMAHLSALFVSEAAEESEEAEGAATVSDELALSLQQTAAMLRMRSLRAEVSKAQPVTQEPEGERDPSRQLVIKQVLLVGTRRFGLGGRVNHLSAARLRNVPVLVAVTSAGARVLDLTDATRPRTVQTIVGRAIHGAAVFNDRLLVWGEHGMSLLSVSESRVGLPAPWLRGPVLDATMVGGQLAVLTTEGVSLHSADLSCAAHLPAAGASSLLAAGPRLLISGRAVVEVFDLSLPGSPRREGEHALSACSLHAAPPTNDSRSVVFRRDASGGGRVLALDEGGVTELVRYARDPWFHRTVRVGDLVARLDRDGTAISVLRIANTYEA